MQKVAADSSLQRLQDQRQQVSKCQTHGQCTMHPEQSLRWGLFPGEASNREEEKGGSDQEDETWYSS